MAPIPVIVLGGYGVFGSRICRRLAADGRFSIVIAGRSEVRARAHVAELRREHPEARLTTRTVDIERGMDGVVDGIPNGIVINTVGPFQAQDYRVAEACIAAGAHYIDIADGRDFVCGFGGLDDKARSAGVIAVSGASSVPGLSSSAVDALRHGMVSIEHIRTCIAPGNQVPRGLAVMRAILGYVGKPFRGWRDGAWRQVFGWQELRRLTLTMPKEPPIPTRWVSACDVPDNELFAERYGVVGEVSFHAGLELGVLHLGLWGLSWLVRAGLIGDLSRFAEPISGMSEWFVDFGSDRGGMMVEVVGRDEEGRPLARRWTVIAGSGHGPHIPAMPAVIIAKQIAAGAIPWRGARPCLELFTLDEFGAETANLDIRSAITDQSRPSSNSSIE